MTPEDIRHLESLTTQVWPAARTERLCGWVMGFDAGVTRRANSTLPVAWTGELSAEEAIGEAERRYSVHGLAPAFKITDASLPGDLDGMLAAKGYELGGKTTVMTLPPDGLRAAGQWRHEVTVLDDPNAAWCEAAGLADSSRSSLARLEIIRRIAGPRAFPLVMEDGQPVGAAIASAAGGWVCLSGVHVVASRRGRGIGRSLMAALADWAGAQDVRGAFLQVEAGNSRARALYERSGWNYAYDYHYRVKPIPG